MLIISKLQHYSCAQAVLQIILHMQFTINAKKMGSKETGMKPHHNHSIPWPEPSVAFRRVLNDVVDVAALVVALGEGEAEAAFLRLHQGHVELHFLQKNGVKPQTGWSQGDDARHEMSFLIPGQSPPCPARCRTW